VKWNFSVSFCVKSGTVEARRRGRRHVKARKDGPVASFDQRNRQPRISIREQLDDNILSIAARLLSPGRPQERSSMTETKFPNGFSDCMTTQAEAMKAAIKSGTTIARFRHSEQHNFYTSLWDFIRQEDLTDITTLQACSWRRTTQHRRCAQRQRHARRRGDKVKVFRAQQPGPSRDTITAKIEVCPSSSNIPRTARTSYSLHFASSADPNMVIRPTRWSN
jgi:hypothetical protein